MRPRPLLYVLLFCSLACSAGLAFAYAKLQRELAQTRTELREVQHAAAEEAKRITQAANTTSEVVAERAQPRPAEQPRKLNPAAQAWENPVWRAARFNDAIVRIEGRLGRFFQSLKGWSPERIEGLKQQMANNDVAIARAALPLSSPPTESEMQAMAESLAKAVNESELRLRDALGEAEYGKLQAFEQAENYRSSVAALANSVRAKGLSISGDEEEIVLGAYATALHRASEQAQQVDLNALHEPQRSQLAQEQREQTKREVMKALSRVLEPQQVNAFMGAYLEHESDGADGSPAN